VPRLLALLLALCAGGAFAGPLGYGDPTQPGNRRAAVAVDGVESTDLAPPPPRWTLSSTLIAGQRRVAVINGRSVALGARIEGARLLAVDARGALIEHQGRRIRLELPRSAGDRITAKMPTGR
jgi:hypothetical protein